MIVSLTDDALWLQTLAHLPALPLPAGPVVLLSPHPDDETLGAGALLATLRSRGVAVRVVAITDGENAYDTGPEERVRLRATREREQCEALAELGVPATAVHRLRMPDSGLAGREEELADRVLQVLGHKAKGIRPTLIAPWSGDFHPDHEVCARAGERVAAALGSPLLLYFFWTWHRGTPALLQGLPLARFQPDANALACKARALAKHVSQLHQTNSEPILPERLLGPARWPFEVFLPA